MCVCVCVRVRAYVFYPAHKVHVPYYCLWPVWLYHIFPDYLINSMILKQKGIIRKMCVLISLQSLPQTFPIFRRIREILS